jgi:hypothetical protein
MFCAPGLIFGGTESIDSRFYVLRARIHFRLYRGIRVPFSCFALPDMFLAMRLGSSPVFLFSAPGYFFSGTEGVRSRFTLGTHFRRNRGRRLKFSCFFVLGLIFDGREDVGTVFMFCVPGLIFGGAEVIGSHFHVLPSRAHFRRYRGRRVSISYFAPLDSFSAVPRASGPVFMF